MNEELNEKLFEAIKSEDIAAITNLLDQGADVNARDKTYGGTPLMWACAGRKIEVIKLILDRGADVNALLFPQHCGSKIIN